MMLLFQENKINSHDQANASGYMIPLQAYPFEKDQREKDKDHQCDDFLNNFQLHKTERSAVTFESQPVGGHLGTVFEKSDTP